MSTNPTLKFFRANGKGTGCALALSVHPATGPEDGYILAEFANQMTVGNPGGEVPTYPKFDWEHTITVKLGFDDLSQMLQVMRGEHEALGANENGIYHRTRESVTKIDFRHLVEPTSHYSFEVYRTGTDGEERHAYIILSSADALGLCCALEGVMHTVAFGC